MVSTYKPAVTAPSKFFWLYACHGHVRGGGGGSFETPKIGMAFEQHKHFKSEQQYSSECAPCLWLTTFLNKTDFDDECLSARHKRRNALQSENLPIHHDTQIGKSQ